MREVVQNILGFRNNEFILTLYTHTVYISHLRIRQITHLLKISLVCQLSSKCKGRHFENEFDIQIQTTPMLLAGKVSSQKQKPTCPLRCSAHFDNVTMLELILL